MLPPHDEPASDAPVAERAGVRRFTAALGPAAAAALLLVACVAVLGLYLRPYATGTFTTPIGDDTSWYIGRQRLVSAGGLDGLDRLQGTGVPLKALPDRPGHPVSAALLSTVTGIGAYELAFVLPAAIALIVGLAAGGLALTALREPPWVAPLYVIGVGASVFVARTAVMSHDNLIVDALLLAVAAFAIVVSDGGRGTAAAAVLLAAAALTHWRFVAPFLLLLAALVVALAPDALRRSREGESIGASPAARLARLLGVGTAVSAGALGLLAPAIRLELPQVQGVRTEAKSAQWMPPFRLSVTAPWAALGAVAGWWPADARRRRTIGLMAMWALSIPLAWAVSGLLDGDIPIYRVTAFALGLPVLATVLVAAAARFLVGRWGSAGAIGAAALGIAGSALTLSLGDHLWSAQFSPVGLESVSELRAAEAYLSSHADDRPAIFVIERGSGTRERRAIRAVFSPATAARSAVYLGPTENLLAGRPTLGIADARYDRKSLRAWRVVRRLLQRDPVVLRLDTFSRGARPSDDWPQVAPGVAVVRGPSSAGPPVAPPATGPEAPWLAAAAIALVAIATAVGSGWSFALVDGSGMARVLFAPSFGLGMLVLFGVAADRMGSVPAGPPAFVITVVAAAAGWALWGALRVLRRRDGAAREETARSEAVGPSA